MKTRNLLFAVLGAFLLPTTQAESPDEESVLKRGGSDATVILQKARSILSSAMIFASRAVGQDGEPTSSCWAFTVVVRYDRDAKKFLTNLFEHGERPEQRLYGFAGMVAIDPTTKKIFTPERLSNFREMQVQTQYGCVGAGSTFEYEALQLLEHGAQDSFLRSFPRSIGRSMFFPTLTPPNE